MPREIRVFPLSYLQNLHTYIMFYHLTYCPAYRPTYLLHIHYSVYLQSCLQSDYLPFCLLTVLPAYHPILFYSAYLQSFMLSCPPPALNTCFAYLLLSFNHSDYFLSCLPTIQPFYYFACLQSCIAISHSTIHSILLFYTPENLLFYAPIVLSTVSVSTTVPTHCPACQPS